MTDYANRTQMEAAIRDALARPDSVQAIADMWLDDRSEEYFRGREDGVADESLRQADMREE